MRTWNKWFFAGVALTMAAIGVGPALAGEVGLPRPVTGTCADAALLFCEDFDELPLGAANSPDFDNDLDRGTLTVERAATGRAGNQVLHARTDENGRARLVVPDFSAPGNSFFGRARVRVEQLPTAPDFAHWVLVEATGPEKGTEIVRPLGGQFIPTDTGGENRLGIGSDGGPTGDWTDHRESAPAAEGKWQCFEWEMRAADNSIAVWIDGVANPDLTVSTTKHGGNPVDFVFPTFDKVAIGWQLFQADPTPARFDVLLDDVALGTRKIGC
jgi:hypothetical protein